MRDNPPSQAVVPGGFLEALPRESATRLLAEAIAIDVPAGSIVYREDEAPRVIVVVSGLLRVFLHAPDGRQLTVRYARPGDVAGLPLVLGGPAPLSIEALMPSSLVALRPDTLRSLLGVDARVARACVDVLTRQFREVVDDLAGQAFQTVGQRLARHLLDLAQPADHLLVVTASQQQLADAVGSVREVVARVLREFRDEGLVRTGRDRIVITDAARLSRLVAGGLEGTG